MGSTQDAQARLKLLQTFSAEEIIGNDSYLLLAGDGKLKVVPEDVGGTNEIVVRGKIHNQTAWADLTTITGDTVTIVDVSVYSEVQFECTVFDSPDEGRLVVEGFFSRASGSSDTASNLGVGGEGVFAQKVGNDFQFKSLIAGSGIGLSSSATQITISATSTPRLTALFDTVAGTAVGDLVYITGADFVEALPDNAFANIPNGLFGVAFTKPTAITVEVLFIGIVSVYVGLTPGLAVYIHTDGTVTHTPPLSGMLQQIGFAISSTEVFFQFHQPIRIT